MQLSKIKLLIILLFINGLFITTASFISSNHQDSSSKTQNDESNQIFEAQGIIKLWNTTWGGIQNDYGMDLTLDASGNIYVCGITQSYGEGSSDFTVVKFYPNGTKVWNTTWGGNDTDGFHRMGISLDSDGNIYVVGETWSYGAGFVDFAIVKFYPNGTKAWNMTWGGSSIDSGCDIKVDSDGNIYATGSTISYGAGDWDLAVIKLYKNGTKAWNVTWGGNFADTGFGIALDSYGNIYTTGDTINYGLGSGDFSIVKLYPNGTLAWNVTWGGPLSEHSESIILDSYGNIYASGWTDSYGEGSDDIAVVKFFPNGTKVWNRTWGGTDIDGDIGLALDSDENIYVFGKTKSYGLNGSNFVTIKFYPNGTKSWNTTHLFNKDSGFYSIVRNSAGNLFTVGSTNNSGAGGWDFEIIKIYIDEYPPIANHPPDLIVNRYYSESIEWVIMDNFAEGYYRVIINGTPSLWRPWTNNTIINYPINTSVIGTFTYVIEFNDSEGNLGAPDTVIVTVNPEQATTPPIPSFLVIFVLIVLIIAPLILKRRFKHLWSF